MASNYIHRVILIVPVAKCPVIVAWWTANLGTIDANFGPSLNATGNVGDPETYRWTDAQLTDAQMKALGVKICQLASVTPPTNPQWNGWTQAQKVAWAQSVQASILSGYGAWVTLADNAGAWDSPQAQLTAMGLKVREEAS